MACPAAITQPVSSLWRPELVIYILIWCGSLGYSCYAVYIMSEAYKDDLNPHLFEAGWEILGRPKDVGDYEWSFFYGWFWVVLPWFLAYTIISQLLQIKVYKHKWEFSLVFSVVCLCKVMGWTPVLLITFHCLLTYLASLSHSKLLVWVTCLLLLSTLNFQPFITLMKSAVPDDPLENHFYLLLFTLALSNLRYTSFCLEKVTAASKDAKNPKETITSVGKMRMNNEISDKPEDSHPEDLCQYNSWTFINLLTYTFYLPLFFTGPLLTYDLFVKQMSQPKLSWTQSRVMNLCLHFTRILFWGIFIEGMLHYFYFHSLQGNPTVMSEIPLWGLAGIGYLHGQFFMLKYLVMFGFPAGLARVDGLSPPEGPKCISRISNYSDMWKYFDRGLYNFIKRYIYVPLGGSRYGLLRQLTISAIIFTFMYYWHGAEFYLFIWAGFNFLGITVEVLAHQFTSLPPVQNFETKYLGRGFALRLHALCTVPMFAVSALSIFVFFGGVETGQVYLHRLLVEGYPVSWLIIGLVLYCGVHVCAAVDQWEQRMMKQKVL